MLTNWETRGVFWISLGKNILSSNYLNFLISSLFNDGKYCIWKDLRLKRAHSDWQKSMMIYKLKSKFDHQSMGRRSRWYKKEATWFWIDWDWDTQTWHIDIKKERPSKILFVWQKYQKLYFSIVFIQSNFVKITIRFMISEIEFKRNFTMYREVLEFWC